jgi:type I restriction enzyme S subunit
MIADASTSLSTGLKPYPEYKETGLPWLGRVPGHWVVKRAKSIFQCIDQRSKTGKEELLTVSSKRGVVPRKTATVTMFKAESYLGYKLCWPGDLVINSLWAWAGGLGVSNHHGIISSAYGVYRIRQNTAMTPAFVHEVVRSSPFSWEFKVRSKGVWTSRLQLTDVSFFDAPMHMPPLPEQEAIVRFLGWANSRLDRAIRAKRKVITLLNEQKQVIIHRAVTRGLDPSVPLKPSGIPWLGDIPSHWEVMPIGMAMTLIQTGPFGSQLHSYDYVTSGIPVINPSHMKNAEILPSADISISKEKAKELERHKMFSGDVVAARRGELGRCALVMPAENGWICGTGSLLLRCKPNVLLPAFFSKIFSSNIITEMLNLSSIGATMANLNSGMVARQRIPVPPVDQQEQIVRFIDNENRQADVVMNKVKREIDLLCEYRTRLVADVVTGKLDVRNLAATLSEETAPHANEYNDDNELPDEEVAE